VKYNNNNLAIQKSFASKIIKGLPVEADDLKKIIEYHEKKKSGDIKPKSDVKPKKVVKKKA
jgi:hypothetical protein